MANIATGLDQFGQEYWKRFRGQSLGLLANQASVDHNLQNAKDVISSVLPGQLKITFGPQHGFTGEDQDNMVETEDYVDPALHIPAISLYGKKTDRLSHFLDTIDLLVIDLQDVGTRVYTFISTMLFCLRQAQSFGRSNSRGKSFAPRVLLPCGPFRTSHAPRNDYGGAGKLIYRCLSD
jgi:uncharacterized protein YbbC (DUF1343 family)